MVEPDVAQEPLACTRVDPSAHPRSATRPSGGEPGVDVWDRDRRFADGRRDPLHGPVAGVAHREHAGDARLVGRGRALERPMLAGLGAGAGEDVAVGRQGDLLRQPGGMRAGTDQDVERRGADAPPLAGRVVTQLEPLEAPVSAAIDDLRLRQHLDVGGRANRLAQILRHVLAERGAADHQSHVGCGARQVQRRLAGRVAPADDVDVPGVEAEALDGRSAVVDAGPRQGLQPGDADPGVGDPGGEQDRAPGGDVALIAQDPVRLVLELELDHLPADRELDPEHPRLLVGALRKLGPGDAASEAEVVADQRARARLAADRLALDDEGPQALRLRVDRRGETGRTGAHDHQIEVGAFHGPGVDAERPDDLLVGGVDEHGAVPQPDHRPPGGVLVDVGEQLLPPLGVGGAEAVRHPAAAQQVADLVRARRRGLGDDRELERARRVLARPLVQELGDRAMKLLLPGPRRLEDVVVGQPLGHRVQDRLGGRRVAPSAPVDQQRALGVRVQLAGAVEHVGARPLGHENVGEHDRHVRALVPEALELALGGPGVAFTEHLVVLAVAATQLGLGARQRLGVVIGDEDDRLQRRAHDPQFGRSGPPPARALGSGPSPGATTSSGPCSRSPAGRSGWCSRAGTSTDPARARSRGRDPARERSPAALSATRPRRAAPARSRR